MGQRVIRVLGEEDHARWNAFAANQPHTDFQQSWEWGELKARSGWQPVRLALEEGGTIVAGSSVLFRPLPGLRRTIAYAPRGPLVDWEDETLADETWAALVALARQRRAILLKIDPVVEISHAAAADRLAAWKLRPCFKAEGFGGEQPRCVMRLDLTPDLDTLLANCNPMTRRNIRYAQRRGAEYSAAGSPEDLREFYAVLQLTARRQGFVVRNFSYFEDLWGILGGAGLARLGVARYEGKLIAGALSLRFGDQCWYLYGASSDEKHEYRRAMPNYGIQWDMIQWAKANGCRVYDFRGVSQREEADDDNDPLGGLNRFKRGFNAQFVEWIGEYDRPLSPVWYPLWVKARPRVKGWLRRRRREGRGAKRNQ